MLPIGSYLVDSQGVALTPFMPNPDTTLMHPHQAVLV